MEWGIIGAFIFGLLLIYIIVKTFFLPIKYLVRFILNGIIGGILLWFFNAFGNMAGIVIPINPITAVVAGFLGIPGVILLIVLQLLIS